MTQTPWLLYGATGYTGQLIAELAAQKGERPILAGRNQAAVAALAQRLELPHRVFPLDDPAALAEGLAGVSAVLHAAGPFSRTSAPMVAACLARGVHYLDITGEIGVFEACHRRDQEARDAGCVLMPGVGFDVVPSDCLAASLARALPGARWLELAFAGLGSGTSQGTTKTMIEGLPHGGAIRENGVIRKVPLAWKVAEIPFRDRPRTAVSIPWGDVSTAYYSTGIPNIVVYMVLPRPVIQAQKLLRPFVGMLGHPRVQSFLLQQVEQRISGPDAEARARGRAQLWGRVRDEQDRTVEGTLVTPEGYQLTTLTALESVKRVAAGAVKPGAKTPSMAFGPRFIGEFEGCSLQIQT
jgi:short subunit dehydrogenase-like uncharacterized protein